eukprot:5830822-Pyramimonas_sp.AAC.1
MHAASPAASVGRRGSSAQPPRVGVLRPTPPPCWCFLHCWPRASGREASRAARRTQGADPEAPVASGRAGRAPPIP